MSADIEAEACAEAICRALADARPTYRNEDDLQAAIADLLADADIAATREVRLSDGQSRIDLLAGRVGIEVKVGGGTSDVARQLARYAQCSEISALVLVTTRVAHSHVLNEPTTDKPVFVCSLIGAGL
ncbi:hypothetical protein [Microbacterium rhizophilus]|uniref:hypothetical protein n=1 Tax=Microbacterium rhizophilus TaxID=3138934 RepID=UPI0031EB10B5